MKILSEAEFKAKYGESAVSFFKDTEQAPAPKFFNTQEAKDVFTKASEDILLASRDNPANPFDGSLTATIQGGLAVPRAIGAGLMGTKTGKDVTEKAVSGLTSFGEAITPDKVQQVVGDIANRTIEGYQSMTPEEQLKQRNLLGVAEVLTYFLGEPVVSSAIPDLKSMKPALNKVKNVADDAWTEGTSLRESVQSYVGSKSVDNQVKTSAGRLVETPVGDQYLKGTASRTGNIVDVYDDYLKTAQGAIDDIKSDPPISIVGERIGNAFDNVIKQRRSVGKALGKELEESGKFRVSVETSVQDLLKELDGSGLSYNPKTRQLNAFGGTKFTPEEIGMLQEFVGRMNLLGSSPTVKQIDNFITKTRSSLAFTKGRTGVLGTTNAERIINGGLAGLRNSLDPDVNGIAQLRPYWNANQTYSKLSDFIEEGSTYLGKVTQTGDYAKDASIAKSSVQSILNNGKKDWLIKLEALTDYNALDDSVIALQAMKDAGDFRGLSLLQKVKDGGIPTSKAGIVGAIVDKTWDVSKNMVLGSPSAQTRAYLKTLAKTPTKAVNKVDLKLPDKAIKASPKLPKTKKAVELEKKIAKNVADQKEAIKLGDFELVKKLKAVYQKLVTALKAEIKWIKENGKSQSGHANFFGNSEPSDIRKIKMASANSFADIKRTTPEKMASELTEADVAMANKLYRKDWADIDNTERVQFLNKFNAVGGDEKTTKAFLKEALDEYDKRWEGVDDALGRDGKGAVDIKPRGKKEWNGTQSSRKSTDTNTSTGKKPTNTEVKSGQSANTSGGGLGDSLVAQAKGKSLDEFVKAQTNAYHGTPNKEFAEFKFDAGSNTQNETRGLGVWVTPQEGVAVQFKDKFIDGFMGMGGGAKDVGGTVMPVHIKLKNPKVYTSTKGMESILDDIKKLEEERPSLTRLHFTEDINERQAIIQARKKADVEIEKLKREYRRDAFENFMDDRDQFATYINKGAKWEERYIAEGVPETNKKFIEYLKKQGYDGIHIKGTSYDAKGTGLDVIDQIVAFDPKDVLTRTQLTNIWKSANR